MWNASTSRKREKDTQMAKTVVGLFRSVSDAQTVVSELVSAGFDRNDISVLAKSEGDHDTEYHTERGSTDKGDVAGGAMKGAGTGAAIGGGFGLIAGLASLAIPGFGPVIAAGPLAAALTGAGIGAAMSCARLEVERNASTAAIAEPV